MNVQIEVDDAQVDLLQGLAKYRQDDRKYDALDEQFLGNIFKVGLMSVVRMYGKSNSDPELVEGAVNFMTKEVLRSDFTVDELNQMWEDE